MKLLHWQFNYDNEIINLIVMAPTVRDGRLILLNHVNHWKWQRPKFFTELQKFLENEPPLSVEGTNNPITIRGKDE